jgi:3-hydroxybutyryl-CoA dehydrogenase
MGSGIAQVFAQAGFSVQVHDIDAEALSAGKGAITRSLERFVGKGTLTVSEMTNVLSRLSFAHRLDDVSTVDLVVEAIVEDLSAKSALLARVHAMVRPDVILASNTSAISITALGTAAARPDRVVGMHFMNPVPLMPLVELVRGQATSDATVATARAIVSALGKTAVEAADYPGFIANRVLMPMINEAIFALMEGVGSAEAIDTVMTLGLHHPMGPLALADFVGLDVCLAILDVMAEGFGDPKYRACPLLRRMVAAGRLGRKTGHGFYAYAPSPIAGR